MTNTKSEQKDPNEEILRIALERFKLAEEAETDIRKLAMEDLEFRAGEQWPAKVKAEREADDRPCLTINRTPQFIRQITNDQRQNRPSIKVYPVDEQGDIETAKIFQGLIKHIETNSNGEVAYDTAFEGAAEKGFGYFRILTDYVDPTSFNQEILLKRIRNSFSVYLDPNRKEPDGSDINWGFIFDDIPKEDFIAEYGESKITQSKDWSEFSAPEGWITENTVRVAEYFYKEFETVELVLLSTGETLKKEELKTKQFPEGTTIESTRKSKIPVIKWCKITANEVLEKTDWLGKWIPIIPVLGNELDVNGKVILEGVIRHAKDPQKMYNYMASTEAEAIALAPRAPFIVAEGQIPPEYAHQWKTANKKSHAFLTYKPTAYQQQLIGPPQRNTYEAPVQAITNARMQASEDMKTTTGIYDAALGARSGETSGIAIQRRNTQSQTSNFHFVDNLTRSIRHAGRILVDLIPKVYDVAQAARIIGEEGQQEVVRLNEIFQYKGKPTIFNLSAGKYDVVVETGPSFATKRQEAAASMMDVSKANPQIMQLAGDLMVKNMDWPGAHEIAERLKKMLPPQLQENPEGQAPIPPEIQAQMQQMDQMLQQTSAQLQAASEQIRTKSMELESRERIEMMKLETQVKLKLLEYSHEDALMGLKRDLADIDRKQMGLGQPPQPRPEQFQDPNQNQNFNESGLNDEAATQEQQMPTDGFSSGQFMEE